MANDAIGQTEVAGSYAHWLLRFALASVFLFMGFDKFMGGGIGAFAGMMDMPVFIAALVALAEIGAGVFVVIGAFAGPVYGSLITRLGALMTLPVMFGAVFMVHWGQWHFMPTASHPMGGMMFQITLIMLALYLLARGNNA
ncbi:DoxX family protein [Halopseudomonas sp.]|uniref:DoxX family protein n=1 Tax=Halopseudomonas sp. TaxID=2901191 RepID=UPI003567187B